MGRKVVSRSEKFVLSAFKTVSFPPFFADSQVIMPLSRHRFCVKSQMRLLSNIWTSRHLQRFLTCSSATASGVKHLREAALTSLFFMPSHPLVPSCPLFQLVNTRPQIPPTHHSQHLVYFIYDCYTPQITTFFYQVTKISSFKLVPGKLTKGHKTPSIIPP